MYAVIFFVNKENMIEKVQENVEFIYCKGILCMLKLYYDKSV